MTRGASSDDFVLVDGLVVAKFGPELFAKMRQGGLTAANCTCSIWEDFKATSRNIAIWKKWFRQHDDLLLQVYSAEDILRAKESGKTGVILGWQNISALDGDVDLLDVFFELGIRVVQLTYNTQNHAGAGCWESRDGGLTDFGRDVVEQMQRLGIVIDLSHVGTRTGQETVLACKGGVAYTHICPRALKDMPRNKTDEEIKLMVDHGGFVGVAFWPPFMKTSGVPSIGDYLDTIEYVINIAGEDRVGIGTDMTEGHPPEWFEWLHTEHGMGRRVVPKRPPAHMPAEFCSVLHYPNIIAAMAKRWKTERVERVIGKNWLSFYRETWRS